MSTKHHPWIEERKAAGPVKIANLISGVNQKIGLRITLIVGTMWAAYLFTFLALVALPDAVKQGTYYIVVWLSSSFLQLVLLPIIIVGQNIQAKAADARAESTFKDTEAILAEIAQMQAHLQAIEQKVTTDDTATM